jgi:hypothetical protein
LERSGEQFDRELVLGGAGRSELERERQRRHTADRGGTAPACHTTTATRMRRA